MGNKNIVEVCADYIYYIPVGNKGKIDHIRNTLENAEKEKYVEYLSLKTIIPLAQHKDILEEKRKHNIRLDPIVEEAHAHAFAYYDNRNAYMLMCLKYIDNIYILTFPRFIMVDGNDPQKGLAKEFSRLSDKKLDAILANTIKPVSVIGSKKEAILYVSKLNNKRALSYGNIESMFSFLDAINGEK